MEKTYFVAIADGDFYLENNGTVGKLRIDRLKELAGGNTFACRMEELKALMDELAAREAGNLA